MSTRVLMVLALVAALGVGAPALAGKALAQPDPGDPGPGEEMQGPGWGQGPGMHGMHGMGPGGGMGGRMRLHRHGVMEAMEGLDLTASQRQKLADIHERQQRKAIDARRDLELAQLDLRKLMRAEKPDQRAIDLQIDRLAQLRGSLQKSRTAAMLEARALLTPEQQQKLRERLMRGPGGPRHSQ